MGIQSFLSTRSRKLSRVRSAGVSPAVARAARSCFETLESRQLLTAANLQFDVPPIVVAPTADTQSPTAELKTNTIKVKAGEAVKVVVQYVDKDGSLNLQTLGADDITFQNPLKESFGVTFDGITGDETSPSTYNASYTITGPGGNWDAPDGGTFDLLVNAGAVQDSAGNASAALTSSIKVEVEGPVVVPPTTPPVVPPTVPPVVPPVVPPTVPPVVPPTVPPVVPPVVPPTVPPVVPPVVPPTVPPPADSVGPAVTVSPIDAVVKAGAQVQTVTVTYRDVSSAVDVDSIGVGDIIVTREDGSPVAVTGVDVQPKVDSDKITAVYTLLAPGSSWDVADNGKYSITVVSGAAKDTAGNSSVLASATFNVNVPVPAPVIDSSFSGGSIVNTGFVAEATAALPDGKLLVVGRQGDLSGSSQYILKRINADGSTDSSFGLAGVVSSGSNENQAAFAVTLGADGSIYIAGTRNGNLTVTKFKSGGQLESKFGDNGQVLIDLGSSTDRGYGIAVGADGSVVAVGSAGSQHVVVKLDAKGDRDGSFGGNGVVVGATSSSSVFSSVAVDDVGRIVIGGSVGSSVVVYRYLASGAADTSFGGDGNVAVTGVSARTDLSSADNTVGIAVSGDKIVVAGAAGGDFAVVRLNGDGSVDSSFGTGGVAKADFGGDDDADQVIVQQTGQILVVGTSDQGIAKRLGIAVFDSNGAFDTSFGNGGLATVDSGFQGNGTALHIGTLVVRAFASAQTNGQVVVGAGQNDNTPQTTGTTGLRRLNVPGSGLIGSFGDINGKNVKREFLETDDTRVTIVLRGGSGKAYYNGSVIDLDIGETSPGAKLQIRTFGGDGKVSIRNVDLAGGLRVLNAKTAVISGKVTSPGRIEKLVLRTLDQGTISLAGGVGVLQATGDINKSTILAGANLGADNVLGGLNANADSFAAASINKIVVGGAIRESLIAAGLTSSNATLLDAGDVIIEPATSRIGSVFAKGGIDALSKVLAGEVGKTRVPTLINAGTDPRFSF